MWAGERSEDVLTGLEGLDLNSVAMIKTTLEYARQIEKEHGPPTRHILLQTSR